MILASVYIFCVVACIDIQVSAIQDGLHNRKIEGQDWTLNVTERAKRDGFSASEHFVVTDDGYILTLFRIWKPGVAARGPPVVLMHGLLLSAASWLDAGRGAALVYMVAGAGHDLWLGNARGTHYSRHHVDPALSAAAPRYWRFSVDEIGRYDLPATLDYVLAATGAARLNYIGFSQGAGAFYIMCSERPRYCDKVNVMIALAPATRFFLTKSVIFRTLLEYYKNYERDLIKSGVYEVFPISGYLQTFLQSFCTISDRTTSICEVFLSLLDGFNPGSIEKASIRTAVHNFPAGTSIRNMAGCGQGLKANEFQKYDHGRSKNLLLYGMEKPPSYNLSAVRVPMLVMYGRNDGIVDIGDVMWLVKKLPNVVEAVEVSDPLWTHLNMVYSRKTPKHLFPKIKEYLDKDFS